MSVQGRGGGRGGHSGPARVMSHEATMNRSEVYDFNSSQYWSEMMGLLILWVNSDK